MHNNSARRRGRRCHNNSGARSKDCRNSIDACSDQIDDSGGKVQTFIAAVVMRMGTDSCCAKNDCSEYDYLFHKLSSPFFKLSLLN
jgi:hypothetical protein